MACTMTPVKLSLGFAARTLRPRPWKRGTRAAGARPLHWPREKGYLLGSMLSADFAHPSPLGTRLPVVVVVVVRVVEAVVP